MPSGKRIQLVLVYGRRRVGKSFLINQFFDNRFDFKLVGDNSLSKSEQLFNFYDELRRQTKSKIEILKNWREAFFLLYGKKKQGTVYQVSDYLTMFYYKFVREHYGHDEQFWTHSIESSSRKAWAGK